jgi:hypothetical protein
MSLIVLRLRHCESGAKMLGMSEPRVHTCFSSLSDSSHLEPKLATFSVSVSFVCRPQPEHGQHLVN